MKAVGLLEGMDVGWTRTSLSGQRRTRPEWGIDKLDFVPNYQAGVFPASYWEIGIEREPVVFCMAPKSGFKSSKMLRKQ